MLKQLLTLAATTAMMIGAGVVAAPTSEAAAYRYWTYWTASEANWTFATKGPAFRVPEDGTVEGWRFAITETVAGTAPRTSVSFNDVCGDTPTQQDRKRIALIIDPGVATDAPTGENGGGAWAACVVAALGATGFDILTAEVTVRTQRGLICALNGFPATECAPVLADTPPTETAKPSPPQPTPTVSTNPQEAQGTAPQESPTPPSAGDPTAGAVDGVNVDGVNVDGVNVDGVNAEAPPSASDTQASGAQSAPPLAAQPSAEAGLQRAIDDTVILASGPSEDALPETSGSAAVIAVIIVAVAGVGGAAIYVARRRRANEWDV